MAGKVIYTLSIGVIIYCVCAGCVFISRGRMTVTEDVMA